MKGSRLSLLPAFAARGGLVTLLALGFHLAASTPARGEEAPIYALSADAASTLLLAAPAFDFRAVDGAAVFSLSANFLHRIEAPGWGLVLSHSLDLSGLTADASKPSSGFAPLVAIHEAYARLELGLWGQLFVGKRRMGLGIGTIFAPGDRVDPRNGFWDQKNGFRGIDLSASLGADLSLKAALSLDRNFEAYAAGLRAAAAAASGSPTAAALAQAAYAAALDGAGGPADPRLFLGALSAEASFGALEIAAAGIYAPGAERELLLPSLGLSYELEGLILAAEGAVELSGPPVFSGTAGARYTISLEADSLTLSLDYDYNGETGILLHRHYLLPSLNYARAEVLGLYGRALLELEAPSALLSLGLTLYPAQGFDLELTGLFGLGSALSEFALLPSPPSAGGGSVRTALGFAARVHF